jgi:hypothetical protein
MRDAGVFLAARRLTERCAGCVTGDCWARPIDHGIGRDHGTILGTVDRDWSFEEEGNPELDPPSLWARDRGRCAGARPPRTRRRLTLDPRHRPRLSSGSIHSA